MAIGTTPSAPGWNPRADLDANDRVDDADLQALANNLCGADRSPGSAAPTP